MAGNERTRGNVSHKHKIEMCVPWGEEAQRARPIQESQAQSDISPVSPGRDMSVAGRDPRTARLAFVRQLPPRCVMSPRLSPRTTPIALPLSPSQRLNNLESVIFFSRNFGRFDRFGGARVVGAIDYH
jgi:hypothetical protein